MKRKHHVVFAVLCCLSVIYELMQSASIARALGAAFLDGIELAILFYGFVWTSRQIFGEGSKKAYRSVQATQTERSVQGVATRV